MSITPQPGENTRDFYIDYDAILHQVINHAALVSIRSDWENGGIAQNSSDVQAVVAITIPWLIILSKKTIYRYVRVTGAVFAAVAAIVWIIQRAR